VKKLGLMLVIGVLIMFTSCDRPTQPTTGTIEVNSTPSGARIWLDGVDSYHVTPHTIADVQPGEHSILLVLSGYEDWEGIVALEAGDTQGIYATLRKLITGVLIVNSQPDSAYIWIDGRRTGEYTPHVFLDTILVGIHRLRLTKNGYIDWIDTVEVRQDDTTEVNATLALAGHLAVQSIPTNARVWIDNDSTNYYTPHTFRLGAGSHLLKLTKQRYYDWEQTVEIIGSETTFIEATLEELPFGTLAVNSTPPQAAIWLDYEMTNYLTPHTFPEIVAGTHHLKLTLTGYEEWQDSVVIFDEQETIVEAILDPLPTGFTINSTPAGASIFLNGQNTGLVTPNSIDTLEAGEYLIRLEYPSYFPWQVSKTFFLGELITYHAVLDPAPDYTIAYTTDSTIYRVGCDGVAPETLAINYRALIIHYRHFPGNILWSPDASYLIYSSLTQPVAIIDNYGNVIDDLVGHRSNDFYWSSTSRFVIYGCYGHGIYCYDTQLNDLSLIMPTSGYRYDHGPAYSPNDSVIAFIHHEWRTHTCLYIMNWEGGGVQRITNWFSTSYDENLNLFWISDTEVVFKKSSGTAGIYQIDLDDWHGPYIDPELLVATTIAQLEISPDQQYFAFSSSEGRLHYGQVGSWSPSLLGQLNGLYDFAWTPDNQAIVCRTYEEVHLVELNGTDHHFINLPRNRGSVSAAP